MQLTQEQVQKIKSHWPIEGEIHFHRRVANFVYFVQMNGRKAVLRLTEPGHRSLKEIESELDWMNYLMKSGVSIAAPIAAIDGRFVVEISGTGSFFAAVFELAPGKPLADNSPLSETMVKTWGQYLGRLHRLTKQYRPTNKIQPRQNWDNDETLAIARRSLDPADEIPFKRLNELIEWMQSLPKEINSYGLVHCDLNRGNFFVHEDRITAFDFDDACYHWFVYDIVAPINSIESNFLEAQNPKTKEKLFNWFLEGYATENQLEQKWLDRYDLFSKYRSALIYHWAKTCVKENVFDANGVKWAQNRMPQLIGNFRDPLRLI
jgi:Ser/Thr protein kinase RdoA (MazF antagonist)